MVGSSRSRRSGWANSTAASATRMRQPPEKDDNGRACASKSKPRPARMRAARAGAACASMSTRRVWISAMRCGVARRLGLGDEAGALGVGGEHEVDERAGSARRLLLDAAELAVLGQRQRSEIRRQLVRDHAEQRRLAGAVAPDEADARAFGQGRGRPIEEDARAEPQGDVVDMQHVALVARAVRDGKRGGAVKPAWRSPPRERQPGSDRSPARRRGRACRKGTQAGTTSRRWRHARWSRGLW